MLYHKVVFITDEKLIPRSILRDLTRMYKLVCFEHISSVTDIKKAIDRAYCFNAEYIDPMPVYVYTRAEISVEAKAKLRRYCNSVGITDVHFKHIY